MPTEPRLLRIDGEMTIYRAAELKQQIVSLMHEAGAGNAAIDLSAVSEIDCSGVQLLVLAQSAAKAAGAELRLASPSAAVAEVCGLLNLDLFAAAQA